MADQMNPGVTQSPKHNIGAMNDAITDWAKKRLAKEREIDKAIETHVQHLKDDLSRLDKDIKTDSGIALKYLKAQYKLFKLQEDAKQFMDEDECDEVMDHLRTVFEAMSTGGQLDFVDAIERMEGEDDFDEPSDAVLEKAFNAGRTAGEKGEDGNTNPYDAGSESADVWDRGWTQAQTERAENLGASGKKETEAA